MREEVIGDCRLILGDCLEVLPTLTGVDAVVTDPPYKMRGGGGTVPIRGHGVTEAKSESFSVGEPWGYSLDWVEAVLRLEPKHFVVFCNSYMLGGLSHELERTMQMGAVFVWKKPNAPPNCRNTPKWDCEFVVWMKHPKATNGRAKEFRSQVLEVPFPVAGCFASERVLKPGTVQAAHPTQKPVAVTHPFVERFTDAGQTVLDPFMGSGTTGVACVQTGRKFVGVEIDPNYFDIACRRIEAAYAQMRLPMEEL
jgi:DNA modification methylase